MQGWRKLFAICLLAWLLAGCEEGRDAVVQRTTTQLDQFRELRGWLGEDIGERSGLRVGQSSIGDFVRREHGWENRRTGDAGLSETQVAEALGISVERLQRYLKTVRELDIPFAIQMPYGRGYAAVSESPTGSLSGCSGFLHWGEEPKPDWVHLEEDWYLVWLCE